MQDNFSAKGSHRLRERKAPDTAGTAEAVPIFQEVFIFCEKGRRRRLYDHVRTDDEARDGQDGGAAKGRPVRQAAGIDRESPRRVSQCNGEKGRDYFGDGFVDVFRIFQSALSVETSQKSILGAISVLDARTTLFEPAHLDHIEGRLAVLQQKMNDVAEKKQVLSHIRSDLGTSD